MPIRLRCVHCGSNLRLREELAGRRVRCPQEQCRREFTVPHPVDPPPTVAAVSEPIVKPGTATERAIAPARVELKPRRPAPQRRGGSRARWLKLASAALGTITLGLLGLWRPWTASTSEPATVFAATPVALNTPAFAEVQPFFAKYCLDCHTGADAEGGFELSRFSETSAILEARDRWERVLKLVKVGNMPPATSDQPAAEERQRVVDWLDHTLFYVDCTQPQDPGRVTIRRLNRTEYNHTIRDLVGVDFEPAADFPSDDVGYGFDNIGDVLSVPPLLIEKYLSAAEAVAERAILTSDPDHFSVIHLAKDLRTDGSASDADDGAKVFPSSGTAWQRITFPRDGEYLIEIDAAADQYGDEPTRMRLSLDQEPHTTFDIRGVREREVYSARVRISSGEHRLTAAFINDHYEAGKGDRNLYVYSLTVSGPLGVPAQLPESHRRLIVKSPGGDVTATQAAEANLTPLLRRAFRRPVAAGEVAPYVGLVQQAVERGESFERAMQIGLQAVLVSPQFLFRFETPGAEEWTGQTAPLSDVELASRLSYFLWSSMPDDELLGLAEAGRLRDETVLLQQADRMLKDPRSDALISNFSSQWLGLRKLLTSEVAPDPAVFPEFNETLRRDIWKETELFFAAIIRDDRPITDLVTGRYSFLNERLAKLYGVEGPQGEAFVRHEFTDGRRSGVLTQASVLTLTSYPGRTSPVKRGEWVLRNLLGDAPPEPPPVVPALDATQNAHPELSLRQQLELHRADPTCASCHQVMDEIGFGLENFDAIGRWRESDGKHAIDALGVLPTGERFTGPAELTTVLAARGENVARCVTEKFLTYALGRGLEYYDRCAVDRIVQRLGAHGDRSSELVRGIVLSEPFRLRRAKANPGTITASR